MFYKDFITQIRGRLKDGLTDSTATLGSEEIGRAILAGIRMIQTDFPETRLNSRGLMADLEDTAYTETTANQQVNGEYPSIPLPTEFEAALEAYVLAWCYGREAGDAKGESLLRHWDRRFTQLTGGEVRR